MASRLARIASKADAALDGRYDSTSSEEEEEMRAVPRGCLGKVGAAMVASAKAGEDEYARPDGERSSVVDQAQFRNLQVGVGYRASFVVRQPGSEPPPAPAAGAWACDFCTYVHAEPAEFDFLACTVCGAQRPKKAAKNAKAAPPRTP